MINKSGKWWKGKNFTDLEKYSKLLYKQDTKSRLGKFLQSKCSCGNTYFILYFERNEGIAKRICSKCKEERFICDSEKYWKEAIKDSKPKKLKCVECKNEEHEIGVGFDYRTKNLFSKGDIKWVLVGTRCIKCGLLSSPVDWKIDYSPTKHLERQV